MCFVAINNNDECQSFVKKAFVDDKIQFINLISANSINIARLIPQTIYYFYAYSILKKKYKHKVKNNVVFSVPCGNCGNLTGGLISKKMGLPVSFIACQNNNNVFVNFISTGKYNPIQSVKTFSNAMDVGNPSNIKRINYIYKTIDELKKDVNITHCNEFKTLRNIKEVWENFNYIIDPHTAVGYEGYKQHSNHTRRIF